MIKDFVSSNIEYSHDDDNLFKNGTVLLDEDNQKIENAVFKRYIHKEIANFIHQNYSNIIVLVGAGASVLSNKGEIDKHFGKTVAMLAEIINTELKEDSTCYSLQELCDLCRYPIQVEIQEDSMEFKLNPLFNMEDLLSDILSFEKYVSDNKEKYILSKNKIFELIKSNTSYEYDSTYLKHSIFINTISRLVRTPSKLTLVTTNYDTLIEDAAESIKYTVIDGFTFTHKPHFDSDMFEWNLVKDIEHIKTREMEYKKNIVNLLKLHGSITWERNEHGIFRKEKSEVNTPIMIFPSSNKYMQSYQEPYFELFTKFQELLKRPNTLLITTGFSFADNHISQMIIQAVLHNKSLATLVTDFNITQSNSNWRKLEDLKDHNYKIAFLKATMNEELTDYLGDYYDD